LKAFILQWEWWIATIAMVVAELIAGLCFGWKGLVGMAIGLAATWFNSWALWGITGVLGRSVQGAQAPKGGTALIVIAFLLKLPILLVLGLLTRMIGGPTLPCFVAGLGMVYFGLVGWACAHS